MHFTSIDDCFTLSNGIKLPCIGYGTFKTPDGEETINAVRTAIQSGYRLIDSASVYHNETGTGTGIRESEVAREELFVTTKVWHTERETYDDVLFNVDASMKRLRLDYLDLLLIHWPRFKAHYDDFAQINQETWKAFETLYHEKKVRAIGVSNFLPSHLCPLMERASILPMVDQIEHHPYLHQQETVDFCKQNGLLVQACGPLGQGQVLNDPSLMQIAAKHNKSTAQICVRWNLQCGILPLPKSTKKERMLENRQVFDFVLDENDMRVISAMGTKQRFGPHPDHTAF